MSQCPTLVLPFEPSTDTVQPTPAAVSAALTASTSSYCCAIGEAAGDETAMEGEPVRRVHAAATVTATAEKRRRRLIGPTIPGQLRRALRRPVLFAVNVTPRPASCTFDFSSRLRDSYARGAFLQVDRGAVLVGGQDSNLRPEDYEFV